MDIQIDVYTNRWMEDKQIAGLKQKQMDEYTNNRLERYADLGKRED